MTDNLDLSVVIVNFNTKALCRQTVESVFESIENISCEVIIADNSSVKKEEFTSNDPRVRVYSGLPNNGFGTASNYGAKKASGRYILFLNSDTIMGKGSLDKAVNYMDSHTDIGCLGIKTLLEDGSFDHGCKRGFPTPFNAFCYFLKLDRLFPKNRSVGGYRLTYIGEDETADVDSVSGAFMLMPKEVFRESGGFDENIFMHGEDIDLCLRIKALKKRVVYFGAASMVHLKGRSSLYTKSSESIKNFYNGITYVCDKYYAGKYGRAGLFLLHIAIRLKCRLTLLRHMLKK